MLRSLVIVSGLFVSLSGATAADSIAGKKPNIVFILTDDQGYGDISAARQSRSSRRRTSTGCTPRACGSPTSTSARPARRRAAALMTGRHEFKNGVTHTILERERMSLKATTLAQVLKAAGYTTGIFGKWHLGDEAEYQPDRRGFDEMFIHGGGGIGQTYPGSCGDAPGNTYFDPAILHNGTFEKTKGYCTDVFFAQAIELDRCRRRSKASRSSPTSRPTRRTARSTSAPKTRRATRTR